MSDAMTLPFDYNQWEYYEFVWRFERLVKERQQEHNSQRNNEGRMAMSNLGINMDTLNTPSE